MIPRKAGIFQALNFQVKAFDMELSDFLKEWNSSVPYISAHTSGSTGSPKEIRLLKVDMTESARMTVKFFGLDKASHIHLPLSLDYIAGKMMVVRSIVSGCTLTCETPSSKPLADSAFQCDRLSLVAIVPMQIEGLMKSPCLDKIENVIVGGAPLSLRQEEILKKAPFEAYATYGMTETASHVALRHIGGRDEDLFIGLPGYSFSTDDRGCLVIENPNMSWRRLVTNDVVELSDNHSFRWLSRYDNVINSGGIKLYPEQIEKALAHLLPAGRYFISSMPDDVLGSRLVLVIDRDVETDVTLEKLAAALPKYHAPKSIVRKKLEYTSTGKLKRLL